MEALKEEGYSAERVDNADAGFAKLTAGGFDLALLDINLGGVSGLQLLELIRKDERTKRLPIIMMTVQGTESYKLKGLKGGADDYVVKPFSMRELMARIESLLRRINHDGRIDRTLRAGGIELDRENRRAVCGATVANLTESESSLLAALLSARGKVLSYGAISEAVSGSASKLAAENIHVLVAGLRKKLGEGGKAVETVYGAGYRVIGSDPPPTDA